MTPQTRPTVVARFHEVLRLPGARIEMSGDDGCRLLYTAFTQRLARLKAIQSRRWGVALLRVPVWYDDYLADRVARISSSSSSTPAGSAWPSPARSRCSAR